MDEQGLVCAYVLDGKGGAREIDWAGVRAWRPGGGTLWVHLDRTHSASETWLAADPGIDPLVREALLAEETRPRSAPHGEGLLVILRGINLHPGDEPEDMVSIRLWIEPQRIVSLHSRPMAALDDVRQALLQARGPRDAAGFLTRLASAIVERIGPVIEELEEEVDRLEEKLVETRAAAIRARLADVRRQAVTLRRYIAPQRDMLSRLQVEECAWLERLHRARLREVTDRLMRYVEDLDAARERAAVTQEELATRLAEQLNRNMYMLSLLATIFLPVNMITSLLGINVAGIPAADKPWGFAAVCAVLGALAAFQIWLFRRMKWL